MRSVSMTAEIRPSPSPALAMVTPIGVNDDALTDAILIAQVTGEHINGVFNRACGDERLEMMTLEFAGNPGGGHNDDVGSLGTLITGDFGETHLIADKKADFAEGGIDWLEEFVSGLVGVRLLVAERIVQVGLAVGAYQFALAVNDHGGVVLPGSDGSSTFSLMPQMTTCRISWLPHAAR